MTIDGRTQKDFIAEHMGDAMLYHRFLIGDMAEGNIRLAVIDQQLAKSASRIAHEMLTSYLHGLHWWHDRAEIEKLMGYVG